jgi:SAM-dependent methyltransferase
MESSEHEGFWRESYHAMFSAERFTEAPEDVTRLLALTAVTSGRVLDLCCGPGRHSVEFARRGFAVTGVDLTSFLLDRARERAAEAGVAVEWVHEDMRHFRRPAAFDLACSMFTSWGYFGDEDNVQVLRNIRESLAPGGIFVLETLQRPPKYGNWFRVENEWTVVKNGRSQIYRFKHGLYSGPEILERLDSAGFPKAELYGALDGSEFGLDAMRLVALATAP